MNLDALKNLLAAAMILAPAVARADQAIVVGVNRYPKLRPGHDLAGCVNDARSMARVLRSYGFAVRELLDQRATKETILAEIWGTELAANERFVFYFAGRGTPDTNGDRSALLPSDAQEDSPAKDLGSRELHRAVTALGGRGKSVILDSCCSDASRGVGRIEQGARSRYYARGLRPDGARPEPDAAGGTPSGPRVCYIVAARENEPACETPFNGVPHGVFTYYLVNALARERVGFRPIWADVAKRVSSDVVRRLEGLQHPMLSPAFTALPVFESAEPA